MPRSYRLDLTRGVEALWAGLESDCRRNVRKAERLGIATSDMKDPHLYYKMLDETMRRHGTVSWHPEAFFRQLMGGLTRRDLLWSWSADFDGKMVAGGLFLHDVNEIHFLSGASDPEFGSLPTSYLLHWHAIRTAACAGLRSFHSEASKVRSIDQFKESFRPTVERRHTLIWAPHFVRRAESAFMFASARLRQLRKRLDERS
jgi:lipid II:glycine glycyltransferase (peptidoglycan interpeptide bridge formation enzyme)